jgi:hypothetical protein
MLSHCVAAFTMVAMVKHYNNPRHMGHRKFKFPVGFE